MGRLSRPRHETSWNHQHVIHHVAGFIQIPRTHWVCICTLCYRIMKYPCLSHEQSKYLFSVFLEYILWSKIQRWWKHDSACLSCWILTRPIYIAVVDAAKRLPIYLSNQCLAHMPIGCRLKSTVVWYFPLDRYEGRCSIDIFYQMSTKSTHGSKRIPAVRSFFWLLL